MKILWGIQLTGNGHIRRSSILIERLRELGNQVDIITSGNNSDIKIQSKWNFRGITLHYKSGQIDWIKTIAKIRPLMLLKDAKSIDENYDLVISDFEPVSSIFAKINRIKSISISNQNSIVMRGSIFSPHRFFIKWFAKCDHLIGYDYLSNKDIFQPLCNIANFNTSSNVIVVYLPYCNQQQILQTLNFTNKNFILFTQSDIQSTQTVEVRKITNQFSRELALCSGVITHSGFSTTSEALILGKKLWAIPVRRQYEQKINSENLKSLGVFTEDFSLKNLQTWINDWKSIDYKWIDPTESVIKKIVDIYEKN